MRARGARAPVLALAVLLATAACGERAGTPAIPVQPQADAQARPATFVGSAACTSCHQEAAIRWRDSAHARATQVADASTVLGDFENASPADGGRVPAFYRRDGQFFMRLDDRTGSVTEFPVTHVLGGRTVQQYLAPLQDGPLKNGPLQALPFAWDARSKAAGGQRWLRLDDGHGSGGHGSTARAAHWTAEKRRWTVACADCHSTNLVRTRDEASDRFQSSWSDLNVGCEACHGPGSRHLEWAQADLRHEDARLEPIDSGTCGLCHARGEWIWPGHAGGDTLSDTHRVELLTAEIYHPDGQPRADTDAYEYASYLQSSKAAAGIGCADCHEPHGAQLHAPGDALCARCHRPAEFETAAHRLHAAGSEGARCVACHMPARRFMQVRLQHDHSLRVPRPDVSARLGTPDACTRCHTDRSADWAAGVVASRYGRRPAHLFADALAAARQSRQAAEPALRALIRSGDAPPIVRATAVTLLPPGPRTASLLAEIRRDRDALVRRSAAEMLASLEPQARVDIGVPLLRDPVRAVRLAATESLLGLSDVRIPTGAQASFDGARVEYRASLESQADSFEGLIRLGRMDYLLGDFPAAARAYASAVTREPRRPVGYLALADVLAEAGQEAAAERVLREGIAQNPDSDELRDALTRRTRDRDLQTRQTPPLQRLQFAPPQSPPRQPRLSAAR